VTGTAGNDTINANVVADNTGVASVETLTALDVIDGGAGTDTLNYTTVGGAALPAATISNVEVINVVSDGAVTADVSGANISGVTTLSAKAAAGAVDIDTKANVTSVTVTGTATTVAIDDAGTAATSADKIASVSVTGATGAITVGATNAVDSLTTLSLTQANGGATVTATAGTRALTLNLNEVTAGTIADAEATSLTVNTSGKASSGVTLNAAKATGVTINADEKLTVADVNVAAAKTITVTGDSAVTISATATVTALTSVDASASTGGLTIAPALGTGVAFTGGAGNDAVTLGATTKAIAMGAGDDTVTMSVAVGTGGSVDAGDGTDTLSLAAADATTLSGVTTFETGISNFEKVKIGASATTVANTVNLANLDDINYLISAGVVAGVGSSLTVTNMASGGTFELTGVIGGASSIAVKDAATGTADVLNIKLNGANQIVNTAALTVSSVETINIEATDSAADTTTLDNPSAASTILLAAADATKIVVTGNHGVDFTGSTLTKVTTLDASGVVSVGDAAGATAATIATVGAVTFSSAVTDKAVTVTTGNGADVISVASINDATFLATGVTASTVSTGEGNDTITGSAGKDVIDAGAGNDTITGGDEADQLTGGAGNDKFVFAASTDSTLAKMDVITGFSANTYGQGTAGVADVNGATTDTTKWTGDVLDFDAITTMTKIAVGTVTNAADATVFLQNNGTATADTLGAALDSSTGKLYVDLNSDGTADMVIQLTGVTSLTTAAFADLT